MLKTGATFTLLVLAAAGCVRPLSSQATPPVPRMIACFEAQHTASHDPVDCPTPVTAEGVLLAPSVHGAEAVAAVAEALAELAIRSPSPDARLAAAIWLTVPGDRLRPKAERVAGVVARMRRVYGASDDPEVRRAVTDYLQRQTATEEAIALLREIAAEPAEGSHETLPLAYHAVQALSNMGEPGRAALRALQGSEIVTEPRARARLDQLVRGGDPDR